MIRKYILWLAFFWAHINLVYGQAIGSWQAYPALEIVTANIPAGDKIYVLCNGNLFSYNTQDTEITVYDSPYIKLQLSGFYHPSFSFKISPEAADYLNGYV